VDGWELEAAVGDERELARIEAELDAAHGGWSGGRAARPPAEAERGPREREHAHDPAGAGNTWLAVGRCATFRPALNIRRHSGVYDSGSSCAMDPVKSTKLFSELSRTPGDDGTCPLDRGTSTAREQEARKMMKKFFSLMAMASLLTVAGIAFAGDASNVVKDKQEKMFELIAEGDSDSNKQQIRALFDEMIHYYTFCKGSLGKEWDKLSSDQQDKFCGKLTTLIRCNYKRNLKDMLDYNINYEDEEERSKGRVMVNTLATHKTDEREPSIEVDFLMKRKGGNWMVLDIVTEKASMTKTYKSQFLRILKDSGFDALIKKMDTKISTDKCD
jgi:phospholipid transport system substrate-binding protein